LEFLQASSLTQYLDAAVAANNAAAAGFVEWFQFGGNTFVVRDNDTAGSDTAGYTATEDSVIEITGLVDLSAATFNASTGDLTI
jgi:S-layer protein